jgi:membrane protein YqaA with SNARE-associated domain
MFSVERLLQFGPLGLFIVSVVESIIFPIPPDVLLIPLCMLNPGRSFWYAFLASSGSVLGGLIGHAIGKRAGRLFLERFFSPSTLNKVEILFEKYGGWAVGIAAFTPIPFKVFTIGAGMFRVSLLTFTVASIVGRSGRFFGEGLLVFLLGERAQTLLGRNFELITLGLTLVMLLIVYAITKVHITPKQSVAASSIVQTYRKLKKYLMAYHSKRPGFAKYFVMSTLTLILLVVLIEDISGVEGQVLDEALRSFYRSLGQLIKPIENLLAYVSQPCFLTGISLAGIVRFLKVRSDREHRTVLSKIILLASLESFAVLCALSVAYALQLAGIQFKGLTGPLLTPFYLVMSFSLLTEKMSISWRLLAIGGSSALTAGNSVLTVIGGQDPSLVTVSLLLGVFLVSVCMAIIRYQRP